MDVEFAGIIHNCSFIFNGNLSVKQYNHQTCKVAYSETRCVSSMHQYLTEDAATS